MNRIAHTIALLALSLTFGLSAAHAEKASGGKKAAAMKQWVLDTPRVASRLQDAGATWCTKPLQVQKKDSGVQEAPQQPTSAKEQQVTITVVGWNGDKVTVQTTSGKKVATGTARPVKINDMWDAPRATIKTSLEPGNYRVVCQLRDEEERTVPEALRISPTKFAYTVHCP